MDTQQDRLLQFDRDLLSGKNICSSRGVLVTFPSSLKKLFHMKGLGVIICHRRCVSGSSGIRRYGSTDSDLSDRAHTGYYGQCGCDYVYVFADYS